MIHSQIDRRARRTVPMQFVAEVTYEPGDKHQVRCECRQCLLMWRLVREESR